MTLRNTLREATRSVTRGALAGVGGVALAAEALIYVETVEAMRTGADFTDAEISSLSNFIKSLQGTTSSQFPDAVDLWDNVRVLAFLDATFGVGEGTVVQPVVADNGSGTAVLADDAAQQNGEMIASAPWTSHYNGTTQYSRLPMPPASFDPLSYTVVATLQSGNSADLGTLFGVTVSGETGASTANTSAWRWFADGRLDGFGASNKLQTMGSGANPKYMLVRLAFIRESLSNFYAWRNGLRYGKRNLPSTSASQPTYFNLGYDPGLLAPVKPFGAMVFDVELTDEQISIVTGNLEKLRTSQHTGTASLKLTQAGTDVMLIEAATSDELLIEA